MKNAHSPEQVVQRQLDAYNNKDLSGLLATYAPNADQFEHPAKLVAHGREQIGERMGQRFLDPDLHAKLIQRHTIGKVVIDHEVVTRNFPDGLGEVELTCIYVVENGLIQSGSFLFDSPKILKKSS